MIVAPRFLDSLRKAFIRGATSAPRLVALRQWCASHMSQTMTAVLAGSHSRRNWLRVKDPSAFFTAVRNANLKTASASWACAPGEIQLARTSTTSRYLVMMIGEGVTLHCYIRVIVGCQATRAPGWCSCGTGKGKPRLIPHSNPNFPLSPPPVQRRLQGPRAKSKFLAVSQSFPPKFEGTEHDIRAIDQKGRPIGSY
jgi:hypothetical protein